ncbi:ComF family protein [Pedobacter metabolipauper]|uniref:ComF family protein n=1 Tax=Pedobacter metabolipauper TaxID=425513 RepID=A0A4R6SXV8_9SPHI|nr:phosphoribosyltransferase family protein [Pedobacter metabolipauper]TDQ10053.1 ComF family protein [Pedobacter metabolipauper]
MGIANYLLQDIISLLFPNLCSGCNRQMYHGESYICSKCLHQIPFTDHHQHADNAVARQFWGKFPFHAAMAMLYFRKGARVQNIIHQLKYGNQPKLGVKLGALIAERLQLSPFYEQIDLIVPVPMHKKKERQRGYNQSLCIAQGISAVLKVPVNTTGLIKKNKTETQTSKGRYQRYENMKAVFTVADPIIFTDKHILLVDDVITTGATIEACALELIKIPVKKLSIAGAAFAE